MNIPTITDDTRRGLQTLALHLRDIARDNNHMGDALDERGQKDDSLVHYMTATTLHKAASEIDAIVHQAW